MIVYAFLLILLLRPNWGLWGVFSIVAVALGVWAGLGAGYDAVTTAIAAVTQGVIFCALGALIVFLRLKFGKGGKSKQDKEVDAELARIRAEAAARENQPPPQA
ncbi:hypothetical protein U91I_01324 [alpha proteobacterium U9-1i]|nr:hypothetical protein U91I_01324 [alpha proteobacterium U9-1i]